MLHFGFTKKFPNVALQNLKLKFKLGLKVVIIDIFIVTLYQGTTWKQCDTVECFLE